MKVKLEIIDKKTCYRKLGDSSSASKIFPSQICAGGERGKVIYSMIMKLKIDRRFFLKFRILAMATGKIFVCCLHTNFETVLIFHYSGGPIQSAHDDATCVYDIIGMTSYGIYLCGTSTPAVYTMVYPYLAWIEEIVWNTTS